MITKNSPVEKIVKFFNLTSKLHIAEDLLSKRIRSRKEKLADVVNKRYEKASEEKVSVPSYEINDELNLVLRDAVLDNRAVIRIPSNGGYQSDKMCVTRSYGYKVYKCWRAEQIDLDNAWLSKSFNLRYNEMESTERMIKLSSLIRHKDIDQKKIKHYFRFIKGAIKVYDNHRINIRTINERNSNKDKDLGITDLSDRLGSYNDIETFQEKIESLESLDKLYFKFTKNLNDFRLVSESFLTKIREYNKPFKLLVKLQETNR